MLLVLHDCIHEITSCKTNIISSFNCHQLNVFSSNGLLDDSLGVMRLQHYTISTLSTFCLLSHNIIDKYKKPALLVLAFRFRLLNEVLYCDLLSMVSSLPIHVSQSHFHIVLNDYMSM